MVVTVAKAYHQGEKTPSDDEEMIRTLQGNVRQFGFSGKALAYPNDAMHDRKVKLYVQNLLERLQNGDRLLDIGCGYGSLIEELLKVMPLEKEWKYEGLDLTPELIGRAQEYFSKARVHTSFHHMDGKYYSRKTDWAVLLGVVNSVSEPESLIDSAWKACEKGLILDMNSIEKRDVTRYNTFDIPLYVERFKQKGAIVLTENVWDGCTILTIEKSH